MNIFIKQRHIFAENRPACATHQSQKCTDVYSPLFEAFMLGKDCSFPWHFQAIYRIPLQTFCTGMAFRDLRSAMMPDFYRHQILPQHSSNENFLSSVVC